MNPWLCVGKKDLTIPGEGGEREKEKEGGREAGGGGGDFSSSTTTPLPCVCPSLCSICNLCCPLLVSFCNLLYQQASMSARLWSSSCGTCCLSLSFPVRSTFLSIFLSLEKKQGHLRILASLLHRIQKLNT